MTSKPSHRSIRRIAALITALLMMLPSLLALGQMQQPVIFTLAYTDSQGQPVLAEALPVPYEGYATSYWLYLDPQAQADPGANLIIQDTFNQYPGGFTTASGTPIDQLFFMDAGMDLTGMPLEVQALGPNDETMATYYLYISLAAQQPYPPEAAQPAPIAIHYVDQNGQEFASEQRTLDPGPHPVAPDPGRVPEGYTLTGAGEYNVIVDAAGANPADITFTYHYQPVIQPAMVTIRYVDQNGQEFASEQREFPAGQHIVTPDSSRVPGEYSLTGQGEYTLMVDENGANPADITFTYQKAIAPAMVTIHYVDQNGQEFASEQREFPAGQHIVTPDPFRVPGEYSLTGQGEYTLMVDENGANPSDITFTYHYQPVIQPATITIRYVDQNGRELASEERTLQAGAHSVTPNASMVPGDYALAGSGEATVNVTESGASPLEVTFTYQQVLKPAVLTIRFKNDNGQEVASSQQQTLAPGEHIIEPWPTDMQPDYVLKGDAHFTITVDERGAVPAEVTFLYELKPAVSEFVDIKIYYVDQASVPVASEETRSLGEGINQVTADPRDLKEGYTLADDATKSVTVSDNQASPASLTFVYSLTTPPPTEAPTPTPPPAPKVALVPVNYVSESGALLFSENVPAKEGEQTLIAADLTRVDAATYELTGTGEQTVTVDASGTATPKEVVFVFRDITVKTAALKVHYRDEAGNALSASQDMELEPGTHPVTAPEAINGLLIKGERTVNVTVSETGVLSQAEVVFTYARPATATPVPTPTPVPTQIPFDVTAEDKYAYPNNDNINFRNTPEVKDGNVIGTVSRQDLAHITGSLKNRAGEDWYLAEVNGQQGFLKANVVRILTFNEAAAILGFTPSPAPTATPALPDIPDGAVIDRWGEVTSQGGVNFRSSPSTGASSRIGTLDRGERFWVYEQQTVDGEVWYNIVANGKTGFVVAQYTRLYSQQESDQYQATLASPMPHSTTPTPQPATATPTPAATPTPSPSPTTQVTPTPAPYHGYALTTRQVALRSGVSQQDESILATLQADSLVYVWGQTYVGSEGWNSVDATALSISGYLPDSAIRRITEQEAAPYLEILRPQVTPSPTPTQRPQQMTGYAITLGDHVPMRAYADTNAQILDVLQNSAVVSVRGQEFVAGDTWHLVQYGAGYGFVRADQLRMLSAAETAAYLESLRTPTPTPPAATPAPVTLDSPSSYGYVTANSVRLRRGPSTTTDSLKLMDNNAFALVYGTRQQQDGLWYHINQGGTEGYVMSSYFKVLPMGQLTSYLQSPEYLSANTTTVTSPNVQPGRITSVEDFNTTVWQNPTLLNPSYEPFNPLGTPIPEVEAIPSPSVSPSLAPSLEPLPTFMVLETEAPQKADSSFPIGWVAVGLIALLGGGGYYAYHLYNQNQKRAAQRAAQRRQQAAQQSGPPQARPAQPQQGQSPYAPPRPGQAQQPGGTAPYRPGTQGPGQPGAPNQGTTAYRPGTQAPGQTGAPTQGTTAYHSGTQAPGQSGAPTQGITAYRPGAPAPGQLPPTAPPQGTAAYRPASAPPPTGQQPPKAPPVQGTANGNVAPESKPQVSGSAAPEGETRRRRSDRHNNT
ncbi:MAG: SH3 domain-containing protein [Eubacteriales bacterium]|nr:SH3 domain-containing protein [Eubacteriales bacterium]